MVLLVLAVLWGIVLIPPALRARSERRRVRSVDVFQRRLAKLAPPEPMPAARPAVAARPAGAARPPGAARPRLVVVAGPAPAGTAPAPAPPPHRSSPRAGGLRPQPPSRAAVLRRRRRVLAVLVVAVAATLAGGAVPGLRPLWAVHVVADLGLAAYLAGLLRLRRLALERAAKVRHLPPAPPAEADGRLRRSVSS